MACQAEPIGLTTMSEEKNENADVVVTDSPSEPPQVQTEEISNGLLFCFKCCKTTIFYLMFVSMGSILSIPGTTLLDLAAIVNVDTEEIGVIFTLRSIGILIGAFSGGILLDYFRMKIPTLVTYTTGMAIMALSIPFCSVLYQVQILFLFQGLCIGGLNNGVNVCLLNLWGRKADSYFLALHFSFAVGAFLGPVIAGPFLEVEEENDITNTATVRHDYPARSTPKVAVAYAILSGFAFFMALALSVFSFTTRNYMQKVTINETEKEKTQSQKANAAFIAIALSVAAATIFSVASVETGYSTMIFTYAVKGNMHFTKQKASYLTSVFWATFMLTRFICIFVATRVGSEYLIAFDVVTLVISGLILSLLGRLFEPALWVGSALVGCGVATLFPSMITWVGRYIRVTFKVGSLFFIMGSIAEMIWPAVLASYIEIEPDLLYFYVLVVSVICFLLSFALSVVFRHRLELGFTGVSDAESVRHYYGMDKHVLAQHEKDGSSEEETGTSSSSKGTAKSDSPTSSKEEDSKELRIVEAIDPSHALYPNTGASEDMIVTQSSCEELDESLRKEDS